MSVGQLIEKGYKVLFENQSCLIKDADAKDTFRVIVKGKSFSLNPLEQEQIVFPIKENVTKSCHKRLKHYHHQGLLQMKSKVIANDLP